jgi:hypothetical protein
MVLHHAYGYCLHSAWLFWIVCFGLCWVFNGLVFKPSQVGGV